MAPEKKFLIILSSRGLEIHVLVNRFASYKRWENRHNSSLVKSYTCIISISLIVLGWCCSCYFTSDYSRFGSSQSLYVWQLQDPDVQPLEWVSGSGSWLPLSLFCFSQQLWYDCAVYHTNVIHFHTISCNNGELTHCGMFLMWERNKLYTEVLFLLPTLLYLLWPDWI